MVFFIYLSGSSDRLAGGRTGLIVVK